MKIQRNSNTNPTQFQHKSSTNPTLPATPRQKSNTSGNAKTRVRAGEADASTRTKTHTKHTKPTPQTRSRRKKRVVYLLNYEQKNIQKRPLKLLINE
jgi:hypothetical protein